MQQSGGLLLARARPSETLIFIPIGNENANEPRHPLHKKADAYASAFFFYIEKSEPGFGVARCEVCGIMLN